MLPPRWTAHAAAPCKRYKCLEKRLVARWGRSPGYVKVRRQCGASEASKHGVHSRYSRCSLTRAACESTASCSAAALFTSALLCQGTAKPCTARQRARGHHDLKQITLSLRACWELRVRACSAVQAPARSFVNQLARWQTRPRSAATHLGQSSSASSALFRCMPCRRTGAGSGALKLGSCWLADMHERA